MVIRFEEKPQEFNNRAALESESDLEVRSELQPDPD